MNMAKFDLKKLVRPNIWNLAPYSCARTEFTGQASVYLDANENPYNEPYNRYPDPFQLKVKEKLSPIKGPTTEQICLGNGSDETIDLMYRIFCEPRVDNVVAIEPTYGMYRVCADVNDVEYRAVKLDNKFEFKAEDLLGKTDDKTKVIWICSPNNPTGNAMPEKEVTKVIKSFNGIVVVDEAYIDFSSHESLLKDIDQYANLVALHTFSKAWVSAGLRLGMAFANKDIIGIMNKVKYPYNINILTQQQALKMLDNETLKKDWVKILLDERSKLTKQLNELDVVLGTYPTDANFILTKVTDANKIYQYLVDKGIIVRNRNNVSLCLGCLRISVGKPEENSQLIKALANYGK